jgi:hypothetical protein
MLEALAGVQGAEQTNADALRARLALSRRPAGPVLLISTKTDSALPAVLQGHYNHDIVSLQGPRLADVEFYERPRHETRAPEGKSAERRLQNQELHERN